jgi:hypothetical protein
MRLYFLPMPPLSKIFGPRWMLTALKAQRNPEEEGDYMAFEQLVAEAAAKKEKKKGKEHKKPHDHAASEAAADAPNVPRS